MLSGKVIEEEEEEEELLEVHSELTSRGGNRSFVRNLSEKEVAFCRHRCSNKKTT